MTPSSVGPRASFLEHDDILVVTDGTWDAPKRVRHKMAQAWAGVGNRVLWIETPPFPPGGWMRAGALGRSMVGSLRQVGERLWVGSSIPGVPRLEKPGPAGEMLRKAMLPGLALRLRGYLRRLGMRPRLLVLMQQPAWHGLWDSIEHDIAVYYTHDQFPYMGHPTPADETLERTCCERADIIFSTSQVRAEQLSAASGTPAVTIHHAVDLEWWESNKGREPEEYRHIAPPRVVFTGPVDPRVNVPLLIETAKRVPQVSFVLVGPVAAESARWLNANAPANLHRLGERPADAVPGFVAGASVLLLPYACDPGRKVVGLPLKFYEYCASGHPILSTPFTELEFEDRELVRVEATAEGWVAAIEFFLEQTDRDAAARRQALAQQNTYAHRIELQRQALAKLRP